MPKKPPTGFAIVVAWPKTMCKQAGSWYDPLMSALKISKNNYYKVGHAAVVLVNSETSKCHYFDFGRYHAPFGYGRVRDEETDHDLNITTKAEIEYNEIVNLPSILYNLLRNYSCHGTGYLRASYTAIHFENAFQMAKKLQQQSFIPYGPFVYKGTNCSRFVKKVVLAGTPKLTHQLGLKIPYTISPTPITNVYALDHMVKLSPHQYEFKNHLISA